MQQNLVKNFKEAGFKPETKALSDFEDDYGLEAIEGEDEMVEDEEEEEEEGESGENGEESGEESGDGSSGTEDED